MESLLVEAMYVYCYLSYCISLQNVFSIYGKRENLIFFTKDINGKSKSKRNLAASMSNTLTGTQVVTAHTENSG